uniref:Uncharacterized protein n=1 Tax=viral metagenome TaxID=1070528 RepID=A0A6M3JPV9_9ZZZZ
MNLCKKIDGKYYCIAKTYAQQTKCSASKMMPYDDPCFYGAPMDICNIGDLIESDQKTLDQEGSY